ncbi:hypothetical protein F7734_10120 [Scytonema sp. UIC 10036]|uniref:hypothetical protein n=1 Tax=Scytonema sp. UIC 10036 TaxID=2304196 RepID=UPI0012DAC043|nr:hypothetical protein [Scytonema sp. UIC 10036]MUG92787.1 hypothetical protein [Scytonema sp. UIC 10036]
MSESQFIAYNCQKQASPVKSLLDQSVEAGQELIDRIDIIAENLINYAGNRDEIAIAITDLRKASACYQREVIKILREEKNDV